MSEPVDSDSTVLLDPIDDDFSQGHPDHLGILNVAFTPLNALNSFLAVARRRRLAAAARDLGVSASALSQSVQHIGRKPHLAQAAYAEAPWAVFGSI